MAYDEELDARVTEIVEPWGATRTKMFGGTGHMLDGNMMAGVWKDDLVLRLGAEVGAEALREPFVAPFDVTGHPMKGWVMVAPGGADGAALERWLESARDFAATLPPK